MHLLLGKICKQNKVNGGCIPNPGTTPITGLSLQWSNVCSLLYHCIKLQSFFYFILLVYTDD
jgi:hypothetical protein